jgi:hypothetical protein
MELHMPIARNDKIQIAVSSETSVTTHNKLRHVSRFRG